jgi:hypothetical protein
VGLSDSREIEKFCCNQTISDEVSLDQSGHNRLISFENEIRLDQSDKGGSNHLILFEIEISFDQGDDNHVSVDQSDKNDNNHLISFENEIRLDLSQYVSNICFLHRVPSHIGVKNDVPSSNTVEGFSLDPLMILCDILLKNLT